MGQKNFIGCTAFICALAWVRACGLARYARSAGGIRVLAYVHRLLYRWVIVVPGTKVTRSYDLELMKYISYR